MTQTVPSGCRAKAALALFVRDAIEHRGLTQSEAAAILGSTQPDVSDLTRGKLTRFSIDRLLRYLGALDIDVHIHVGPRPDGATHPGLRVERVDSFERGLPQRLHRYFWDYDPGTLRLDENRRTVVRRLLESGGLDAVRWLRSTIGDGEIREVLLRRRGRGMTPKRLRFWALAIGLPQDQVDSWIDAQNRNPWARRVVR